ncbi:Asp23/Gls24 family envelope stress response protein [Streptomyces kanamyceticus]|uniref:Asp23/Gls24 family envelope stress response protein n=1 Tax=Streptomyces kanamyceticus TaxID=1967 RepID=A0A5J6GPE6_STRKN|nr:Asp23/Gls24 family envelope stress response protein [Streptomyces kanamyceticus]
MRTPGVAFLKPGLAELLRSAPLLPTGRSAGVRVWRDRSTGHWHAEVQVVVRRDHRALDVTREIRAGVTEAVARETGGIAETMTVTVTVSGLV